MALKLPEDCQDVRAPTSNRIFLKRIAEQEKEATINYMPFCRACAWDALSDALDAKKRALKRETGIDYDDHPSYLKVAEGLDLEPYYGEKCHTRIGENPQVETKISNLGRRETGIIGYYLEYECKIVPTAHKCSIYVPIDDYEKLKMQTKKNKPATTPPVANQPQTN